MWFLSDKNTKKKSNTEVSLDVVDPRSSEGHCFISGNVHISGEVQFGGTLRIDGRVDGKISVFDGKRGTLILSRGAFVNGPVEATEIVTDGTIYGDVYVENKLECRSHSVIKGDMQYGAIQIGEGAQMVGKCTQRSTTQAKITEIANSTPQQSTPSLATRDVVSLRKNG